VTLRAMDLYRVSSPRVDPQALPAEFEQIIAADREGNIDKVLPGASSFKGFGMDGGAAAQPEMEDEDD
jgi:hypothetical protein